MSVWYTEFQTPLEGLEAFLKVAQHLKSDYPEKAAFGGGEYLILSIGQTSVWLEVPQESFQFDSEADEFVMRHTGPTVIRADGDFALFCGLAEVTRTDWRNEDEVESVAEAAAASADSGGYTALIPFTRLVEGITLFVQILGVNDEAKVRDALASRLTQLEEEQALGSVLELLSDPRITLEREAEMLQAQVGDGVVEFRAAERAVALSCSDAMHRMLTARIPRLRVPGADASASGSDFLIACRD